MRTFTIRGRRFPSRIKFVFGSVLNNLGLSLLLLDFVIACYCPGAQRGYSGTHRFLPHVFVMFDSVVFYIRFDPFVMELYLLLLHTYMCFVYCFWFDLLALLCQKENKVTINYSHNAQYATIWELIQTNCYVGIFSANLYVNKNSKRRNKYLD